MGIARGYLGHWPQNITCLSLCQFYKKVFVHKFSAKPGPWVCLWFRKCEASQNFDVGWDCARSDSPAQPAFCSEVFHLDNNQNAPEILKKTSVFAIAEHLCLFCRIRNDKIHGKSFFDNIDETMRSWQQNTNRLKTSSLELRENVVLIASVSRVWQQEGSND